MNLVNNCMKAEKVTIELPSYMTIDTEDGLKIEIDTDKYLSSIKTYEIVYHLEGRHDYDPLDDADDDDLIEELKNRNYDFAKELSDDDVDCEYFNRGLSDDASVMDCLIQAAKSLAPRRRLDKATLKEVINEFIDSSVINKCYN